jgi:hypothetical protein
MNDYNPKNMAEPKNPNFSYRFSKIMFQHGSKIILGILLAWISADYWMEYIPNWLVGVIVIIICIYVVVFALDLLWRSKNSVRPPHGWR